MNRRDAAYVANLIGKTENWVKRHAPALPHHKAGKTYYWTDEDVADLLEQQKHRPGQLADGADALRPITGRRSA